MCLLDYCSSAHRSPFYQGPRPRVVKRAGITISLDGRPVAFDVAPFILDGHTLCQVRPLAEGLGASVKWEQASQMVTLTRGARTARFQVGSEVAIAGTEGILLEEPPFFVGENVVVPLRFVAQALGCSVQWEDAASRINIVSK